MRELHFVVPDGIDDPARPSGGNAYDRQVSHGLREIGWSVREHGLPGDWPRPDATSYAALAGALERVPDDAVVLLDGLVASTAPDVLAPHARRLRLVVLVHMPLGHRPAEEEADVVRTREREALTAATAVVTTSEWTRHRLLELYSLPAGRIHVARPGVDPADLAPGTAAGGALLCVAAVTVDKGHDVLLDALGTTMDLPWHCTCVGSLGRDPAYAEDLRRRVIEQGLADRVSYPGAEIGPDLDRRYAAADVLVLASRAETYGMVVTEALARGLPVLATNVGGVPEALGDDGAGTLPGLLVPSEDPVALGTALRTWLTDPRLRERLRRSARARRQSLSRWSATTAILGDVLGGASR